MSSELLALVNFHEYTLSDVQFKILASVIAFIFVLAGVTGVVAYPKDKRKRSWIISLVNSFGLSAASIVYIFVKFPLIVSDYRVFFHAYDNVSIAVCIWLFMANIFDLAFGVVFYPAFLDPLSAWVHHILYIWVMIVAITGKGGFADFEIFASGSAFLLIEEVPTFFLALGAVFPSLRTDLGFGLTFLVFRLCFHAAMLVAGLYYKINIMVLVIFALSMIMHIFWFSSWYTKYGKKLLFGTKADKVE